MNSLISLTDEQIDAIVERKLDDDRLSSMVDDLQKESVAIKKELLELSEEAVLTSKSDNYKMFFELTRQHTHIETLDRDTLLTFVDRIEVGPKILPEGNVKASHRNSEYSGVELCKLSVELCFDKVEMLLKTVV